jgi:predicted transcriptional regulator
VSDEIRELRNIKKLLIMLLIQNDVKVGEIARALGVDQSAVSHMLSPRGVKNAKEEDKF